MGIEEQSRALQGQKSERASKQAQGARQRQRRWGYQERSGQHSRPANDHHAPTSGHIPFLRCGVSRRPAVDLRTFSSSRPASSSSVRPCRAQLLLLPGLHIASLLLHRPLLLLSPPLVLCISKGTTSRARRQRSSSCTRPALHPSSFMARQAPAHSQVDTAVL